VAISFVGSAVASSSPTTATTITLPTLNANDLIIIAAAVGDTANNGIPAPTGYSRVPGVAATLYSNDANDTNLDLYYKIAVAGDSGATVTLTATGGTNASNAGVAMVFRGVSTTTPFDVNATTATGINTSNADPPSIDHLNPAGVWTVIAASTGHTGGASGAFTFPTNYTTNAAQRTHNDTIDVLAGMGYRTAPADPENPGAFTASGIGTAADNAWAAVTMALRPSSGPAPLSADPGSYTWTGTVASTLKASKVAANPGSHLWSGTAASLLYNRKIAANTGSYTWTGTDATLRKGITMAADPGSSAWIGTAASLLKTSRIAADAGSFTWTGTAAVLSKLITFTASPGAYLLTGASAILVAPIRSPFRYTATTRRIATRTVSTVRTHGTIAQSRRTLSRPATAANALGRVVYTRRTVAF